MFQQVWSGEVTIDFQGKALAIQLIPKAMLDNGWMEFGAKSGDDTFQQVFGENPIPIAVKPKQAFKPDYDLFQNTPEQMQLAGKIWNRIQELYF